MSLRPFRARLRLAPHPTRAPLLPKLRGHFAEFLNEGSPDRLGILYPSTGVGLRYGHVDLARGFSWQLGSATSALNWPPHHTSGSGNGFSCSHHCPTCLAAPFQPCGQPTMPRHPIASLSIRRGAGILTCCPSPTPLGLGLGPTNPTRINLPSETLDLRRTCFSHVSRYSCQHSHFCTLHCSSRYSFHAVQNAPLPVPLLWNSVASASDLSPVTFSAQERLTSELLRTL